MTGKINNPDKQYETWSDYETEEVQSCNFCGNNSRTLVASIWRYKLAKCDSCGFVYTSPRLTEEALMQHYDEDHRLGAESARRKIRPVSPNVSVTSLPLAQYNSKQQQKHWKWMKGGFNFVTKHKKNGKMLDVGFSDGTRLKIAWQNGWEDLYGIEVSDDAIAKVKENVPVDNAEQRFRRATLLEKPFALGTFDVVTFYDVLEHLQDPMANLLETNRILKMGGVVIIVVPNLRRQLLNLYQGRLLHYLVQPIRKITSGKPPDMSFCDIFNMRNDIFNPLEDLPFACDVHLNHFTDKTLTMFLEKSGFRVIENGCDYRDPPGGSRLYRLIKKTTDLYSKLPYLLTLKRRYNFSPNLRFAARKIAEV